MKITYLNILAVFFVLLGALSCKNRTKEKTQEPKQLVAKIDTTLSGITIDDFTETIDREKVALYVLKNKNGLEAAFTNYGQHLVSLMVPDKNGIMDDIVLGFPTLDGYKKSTGKYFGSVIGRYANRIAEGQFVLDGTTYTLAKNNGKNHLHGGNKGFDSFVWKVDSVSQNYIRFNRLSPDMEEGYPGNLDVTVTYHLTDENELKINYTATTDKKTPVNFTHHSFFNLKGAGKGQATDHILQINADSYTPVDKGLIPIGKIMPVANTPFDFREPKVIGQDLSSDHEQIKLTNGYDHNFVLNSKVTNEEGLIYAAKILEPKSGRLMEVFTNQPGVQLYGGNFLDGTLKGKKDKSYEFRGSFCLETQHFPNSPNQKNFPSTILAPGETYSSICIYKFSVE
ncbi:MAG: galactose-1-epimerase [Maribacter sp.]|nr:MAG: galactose-1-epimerase [Maribacter sp.]